MTATKGIDGNVVQVSWRSTQIATFDDNVAIVPNSVIAKSRLINRSSPTQRRSSTATIALDPAARPDVCLDVLSAAALSCRRALSDPAPAVSCKELRGEGSRWDIRFTVAASRDLPAARTELLTAVHHHLRHAGIALAVDAAAMPAAASVPTLEDLLASSDLFGAVAAAERAALAPHFTPVQWRTGETLIREGDRAEALFVIATGVADVTVGTRSVHRLIPGGNAGRDLPGETSAVCVDGNGPDRTPGIPAREGRHRRRHGGVPGSRRGTGGVGEAGPGRSAGQRGHWPGRRRTSGDVAVPAQEPPTRPGQVTRRCHSLPASAAPRSGAGREVPPRPARQRAAARRQPGLVQPTTARPTDLRGAAVRRPAPWLHAPSCCIHSSLAAPCRRCRACPSSRIGGYLAASPFH